MSTGPVEDDTPIYHDLLLKYTNKLAFQEELEWFDYMVNRRGFNTTWFNDNSYSHSPID